MMISRGDLTVFLVRPISAMILAVGVLALIGPILLKTLRPPVRGKGSQGQPAGPG
jgi:TctA family transporter